MYFDRIQLKQAAKQRLKQDGVPSYKSVTLIFLLLTALLPALVDAVFSETSQAVLTQVGQAYQNLDTTGASELLVNYYISDIGMVNMGCSILMSLFTAVVSVGYCFYLMNVAHNRHTSFDDLNYGLNFVGKIILLTVLQTLFVFLWGCLFVIPGIIASYRYREATYALIEDPSINPLEALRRSKVLMTGRKMDLFVLDLSFLGWTILATVCSYIGQEVAYLLVGETGIFANMVIALLGTLTYLPLGIWVTGYMELANLYFYDFTKAALSQKRAQMENMGQPPYGNQPPQNGAPPYGGPQPDDQEDEWEDGSTDPWD